MSEYQSLSLKLKELLKNSPYWTSKTKERGKTIQNLVCPECGDKTAWCYSENCFSVNCNRLSECGAKIKLLDLFADAFKPIEQEYKPTKDDPHRPATVYLKTRGILEALKGLDYEYHSYTRKGCGGAVMFPLGKDRNGKQVYNGRLLNPPPGEGKTHNKNSTSNQFWMHPSKKCIWLNDLYISEGIIEAMSFSEMGFQSLAVLSSGQAPSKISAFSKFLNIVLCFDNDAAGHKALKKYTAYFKDQKNAKGNKFSCSALMPPVGSDFNDFLVKSGSGKKACEYFESHRSDFKFNADLALAKTAQEYAEIFYGYKQYSPQLFEFNGCYYFAKVNDRPKEGQPPVFTKCVSNFTLSVNHYSLNTTVEDEPMFRYALNVKPQNKPSILAVFSAKELGTQSNMTTAFLEKAKCIWKGTGECTSCLNAIIVESKAAVVRQLQAVGYDEKSDVYAFKDYMVDKNGNKILPNKQGFFEVSAKKYVRPPAGFKTITPVEGMKPDEFWRLINQSWQDRGPAAISWVFASWFVRNIRKELNYFPFLSLFGDTQCGKSALNRLLCRAQSIEDEGLPLRKSDTIKGIFRRFSQRDSLFIAVVEANKGRDFKLDISDLLSLYDGADLNTKAVKTMDNQTADTEFNSAIMFLQNIEPFTLKSEQERVVSLLFKEEHISPETTKAFNQLNKIPAKEIASFFPAVMKHRKRVENNWQDAFLKARDELLELPISARLAGTHALILAFHRILTSLLNIEYDLAPYIKEIAIQKHLVSSQEPASTADIFLDSLFEYVKESTGKGDLKYVECVDIREAEHVVWFYLPKIQNLAADFTLSKIPMNNLLKDLENHRAYIGHSIRHRYHAINYANAVSSNKPMQHRSYCFDMTKIFQNDKSDQQDKDVV